MLILIHGPSGSGKTARIVRSKVLAERYGIPILIVKPKLEIPGYRYEIDLNGEVHIPREKVHVWGEDYLPDKDREVQIVFVEDAHLFSVEELDNIIQTFDIHKTNIVFIAPKRAYDDSEFTSVKWLSSIVDGEEELSANCYFCRKKKATKTQRLINDIRAPITPLVLFSSENLDVKHVPACENCYVHPAKVMLEAV